MHCWEVRYGDMLSFQHYEAALSRRHTAALFNGHKATGRGELPPDLYEIENLKCLPPNSKFRPSKPAILSSLSRKVFLRFELGSS